MSAVLVLTLREQSSYLRKQHLAAWRSPAHFLIDPLSLGGLSQLLIRETQTLSRAIASGINGT